MLSNARQTQTLILGIVAELKNKKKHMNLDEMVEDTEEQVHTIFHALTNDS